MKIQDNLYLLIFIVIAIISGCLLVFQLNQQDFDIPNNLNIEMLLFPSKRAETFSVFIKGDYPVFEKELIVDPASSLSLINVKEGEIQIYSLWVRDPQGVEKVIANVQTDKEDKLLEMKLTEGTKEEGRWVCFWKTEDIS